MVSKIPWTSIALFQKHSLYRSNCLFLDWNFFILSLDVEFHVLLILKIRLYAVYYIIYLKMAFKVKYNLLLLEHSQSFSIS